MLKPQQLMQEGPQGGQPPSQVSPPKSPSVLAHQELSTRSHSEPVHGWRHLKVQAVPRRRWLRRGGPPPSSSPRAPLPEPPAPSPRLPGLGARCGQQHRGPFPAASEAPRSKCWFPETSCGSPRLSQPGCPAPEHAAPPRVLYSCFATRSLSAPF